MLIHKNIRHISILLLFIIFPLNCTKQSDRVENLGIFGKNRLIDVAGQDGCTPMIIGRNRILWTFGDTILGTCDRKATEGDFFARSMQIEGMISNTAAHTEIPDDENIDNLKFEYYKLNGKVSEFIIREPDEQSGRIRLWPADGLVIRNRAYLYYMIVEVDQKLRDKIRPRGTALATGEVPLSATAGTTQFRKLKMLFAADEPSFGDCIVEKNELLYIAGRKKIGQKVSAYIARVSPAFIAEREKYDFLARDGSWNRQIDAAAPLFGDVAGELSLSYNDRLGGYIIIYCGLDGSIKSVTFNDFTTLPEKNPRVVFIPPELPDADRKAGKFYYSAKEIFSTPKAVYAVYMNPSIYQPMLIKIPYDMLRK